MRRSGRTRRGVALLMALVALVVAGSFLAAAFYAARMAWAADRLGQRVMQLQGANDVAFASLAGTWDPAVRLAQSVGTTDTASGLGVEPGARTLAWITRASARTFAVTIRSIDLADTTASARTTQLLRIYAPRFPALAALVARGDVRADGALEAVPPDSASACGVTPSSAPAVAVAVGRTAPPPAVELREAGEDSTYLMFGTVPLAALTQLAVLELPPGTTVTAPAVAVAHAVGDLALSGGSGSGILIVDGRLRLVGPLTYRGVIIAGGGLEVAAPGVVVNGMILSAAGDSASVVVKLNGELLLQYSPCAVEAAASRVGRVRPALRRGWAPAP